MIRQGTSEVTRDPQVDARRRAVLGRSDWFPEPEVRPLAGSASELDVVARTLSAAASDHGVGSMDLDRSLSPSELKSLAGRLGEVIDERDNAVGPFVVDPGILRIAAACRAPSHTLQPFSREWITLHSEGSRWPSEHRPKLLLFQCLAAPAPNCGGQTLLRDSRQLVGTLAASSVEVLQCTILAPDYGDTPVLSRRSGLTSASVPWILTMRDPAPELVHWAAPASSTAVDEALLDLLCAMYDESAVRGVHWRPHRLVLIANDRCLHGRSALLDGGRILDRVRIR